MKRILLLTLVLMALLVSCTPAQKVVVTLVENFYMGDTRTENTMSNEYYYPTWVPYHSGYIFEGWFYDQDGLEKFEKTKVLKDTTLFGSWSVIPELITVECTIDTSALTLAVGDIIKSYAYYDSILSNPSLIKVDDPSRTKWTAEFQVKSLSSGTISSEVTRSTKTIGKGETNVDSFEPEIPYTVTVKSAD